MAQAPYSYKYRPYYFDPKKGQRGKLIDFYRGSSEEGFIPKFFKAIVALNPNIGTPEDKWPLFETWIDFTTPFGEGHIVIDEWAMVFLEGPATLLDKIDDILQTQEDWEKLETIEKDYHLKKKSNGQDNH